MDTLLIVGFGDIARRAVPALQPHFEIVAMVRPERIGEVQMPGVRIEPGDLDEPESLSRFAGRASHILHTAPPPLRGSTDPRTSHLLAALGAGTSLPQRLVYISTSGVYGNCDGALVDERRPVNPQSDRARRRVDAEHQLSAFGQRYSVRTVILRAPGIYASDRLPLQRLRNRTPVLRAEDDVYTNHIHADDLAAMTTAALTHPDAEGVYNASDDSALTMSAWFDLLADRSGLERPSRIPRTQASGLIPAPLLSFMSESRRLLNTKIKHELGLQLRYPTVYEGVPARIGAPDA